MPKNSLFTDAFSFEEVISDQYIIPVTEKERKAIYFSSKTTAQKLAESKCFKKLTDEEGKDYFGLVLQKKYSLLVSESSTTQKRLSDTAFASMYELTAELMEQGMSESEVQEIISQPKNYSRLSESQRAKAYKFLAITVNGQSEPQLDGLTILIKTRINRSWSRDDTELLPESLSEKLLEFLEGERNGWSETEDTPKSEEPSTTIADKQKD